MRLRLRLWHLPLALAVLAALGGFAVAWSGIVSVAASSGHYAPTAWFLHFTMRSAVQTQSAGIEVPDLSSPALVALGAGHYAGGCAPCHGAPGEPRNQLALLMQPPPPWLPPRIPTWEPEELFWILKHGIKYSGMPPWATQARGDDVWPVVAFLLALPGMDEAAYRRMALAGEPSPAIEPASGALPGLVGPQARAAPLLANCARCHGLDGAGQAVMQGAPAPGLPAIGGQSLPYLRESLRAYAEGRRFSGIMQPVASELAPDQIEALARHYAEQPWQPVGGSDAAAPERAARGREIAAAGIPVRGVPACDSCHGGTDRYPHIPTIAGQDRAYLAAQLRLFRDRARGGTPFYNLMHAVAAPLTDAEIEALAHHHAALRPGEADAAAR